MEEKNKLVQEYIINIKDKLSRNGIEITGNQLSEVINKFTNSEKTIEEIKKEILNEFLENYSKMLEAKQLQDLQVTFNGITLNNQDIDLMLIACANNPKELQEALSKITNIRLSLKTTELTEQQFIEVRQQVYDMYLDTLTSRNDYIKNRKLGRNIELERKIEYLKSSGILSAEEIATLDNSISSSRNTDEILERLNQSFSSDKVHRMYEIIRDFTPIEKTGIKSSTLEASRNLLEEIRNNYNSITIEEEAKYGKVALQDGSFNFKHLQKALDFAKAHNKQMRLNTLLFYRDCPDELYNLEKTPENKILVKQILQNYVEATTRFVVDNGYSDTVRSVDVFNELLNRFAMNGETPYMYRGDIPQIATTMSNGEMVIDDNIKAGWLKHLDITDLCDVIAVARKNMPTTDFMYNDDHLIDPKKIAPTIELIEKIRENEKRLGVKLIDSIGTQMHIDNSMTKEQMREMIINLSGFGLPIEITEFDIAMTNGVEKLSEEQIETLRQSKINEIYECVDELREQYNIRGFTIWSKTDKQNFRVFLANEKRISKGLEPIETLHGGYYTELMQPKNKPLTLSRQKSALEHAKETIKTSVEMGNQSKEDFKNITTQITEGNTTKSVERQNDIVTNQQTFQKTIQQKEESKKDSQPKFMSDFEKKENERKIDKETKTVNPPVENKIEHENMKTKTNEHNMKNLSNEKKLVLTEKNNNKSNNAKNASSGFSSVVTLALITGFVAGALSMLVYYICK